MTQNTEHQPKTTIETPSTHETRSAVFPEAKESKIGRKGMVAIMGGLATTLLAGGLGAGMYLNNAENKAPQPAPEPSVEAPVVPGEVEATPTIEPTTEVGSEDPTNIPEEETPVEVEGPSAELPAPETLRLSAELPPEELVQRTYELWSDWVFAGATEQSAASTVEAYYAFNDGTIDDFKEDLAKKNADYYSKALLPDNWQEDQFAVKTYDDTFTSNEDFIGTVLSRDANEEPIIEHAFTISNVDQIGDGSGEDILVDFDVDAEYKNNTTTPSTSSSATFRYKVADDGTARLVEVTLKDR